MVYHALLCGLVYGDIRLDFEEDGPALAALTVYAAPAGFFGLLIALGTGKIDRSPGKIADRYRERQVRDRAI
jgi:hypothetical protein